MFTSENCFEIIYLYEVSFLLIPNTCSYEMETAVKFEVSWNAFITVAKF
jgi:hypothetical protein